MINPNQTRQETTVAHNTHDVTATPEQEGYEPSVALGCRVFQNSLDFQVAVCHKPDNDDQGQMNSQKRRKLVDFGKRGGIILCIRDEQQRKIKNQK
jgi:hypothetical protein